MNDPKLKRTSVTVRYTADDGYRSETTYTTSGHHPPIPAEVPLLDALEELARLTALFGFCDEAKARFDAAQKRVSDWREGRKVGAGETATEGHNVAGNRLARQGQSELTGVLGPVSEAR